MGERGHFAKMELNWKTPIGLLVFACAAILLIRADAPKEAEKPPVVADERMTRLEARLEALELQLASSEASLRQANADLDALRSTAEHLSAEMSRQGSVVYYMRNRLAEDRIGDAPTVAGLRLFATKEEVAGAMGEPEEKRIVNEAADDSEEPVERWAWPGATAYFHGETLYQLNVVSSAYDTSFGIRVGDPIHLLAFEEQYGYARFFGDGTSLHFEIDEYGMIRRITYTRDSS